MAEELSAFAISPFRWVAMDFSGHGSSRPIRAGGSRDWQFAVEDITEVLEEFSGGAPVFGVGHSMGGAALLMASLAEGKNTSFRSLVLFEPIVLPPSADEELLNPLIDTTQRRRRMWPSVEDAQEYFAGRAAFSRFDPRAAAAYAHGGTRQATDWVGVELACDPADEAALYRDGPRYLRQRLHEIRVPCHVVSAELSRPPLDADYYRRLVASSVAESPAVKAPAPPGGVGGPTAVPKEAWGFEELPGCGHFLVMENPRAAAAAVARAGNRTGFGHCFRVRAGVDCGP